MTRVCAFVLAVALALSAWPADAETYRWIAPDGSVMYSDRPPPQPVPPTAPVPPTNPAKPQAVEEILTLSGVRAHVAPVARQMRGEIKKQPKLTVAQTAMIDRIATRHLDGGRLYAAIRDAYRREADAAKVEAAATWLRTPMGRRVTQVETASATVDDAQVKAFAEAIKTTPPPRSRVMLIERLEAASGSLDTTTELFTVLARSASRALLPPDQHAALDAQMSKIQTGLRQQLADALIVRSLYVYRTLSDAEIEEYVGYLSSDAGRWHTEVTSRAMIRVFGGAMERTMGDLFRATQAQPSAQPR